MDCIVSGVSKSQTRLSGFHLHSVLLYSPIPREEKIKSRWSNLKYSTILWHGRLLENPVKIFGITLLSYRTQRD